MGPEHEQSIEKINEEYDNKHVESADIKQIDNLSTRIETLVVETRSKVAVAVNHAIVCSYYEVGKYIIEDEQDGKYRAAYGMRILQGVSERLTTRLGKGWSVENLTLMRKFYVVYSDFVTSGYEIQNGKRNQWSPSFVLPWTHYQILMRIENSAARKFYEIEAQKQQWSKRELQRQIGSSLYERLALSRDKDDVMKLAVEGQTVTKPTDILKDPVSLEFLGVKPDSSYSETNLENAIINKLQQFLLEMGKGFLFEARQKRFTFEERYFYIDLVLYNRLLQCYVLIDLKMDDLTHQDLGQMYVNYYDRYVRQDFEKPTIGILLCERKNDALVELTLPKDANIYAQQYALYLPNKRMLQQKLKEWIEEEDEQ